MHGGDLANDVAEQIASKKPSSLSTRDVDVSIRNASERPKTLLENGEDAVICFVMQTIENSNPTEDVSEYFNFWLTYSLLSNKSCMNQLNRQKLSVKF